MNNMELLTSTDLRNHWKIAIKENRLEAAMVERDPEHAEEEIDDCISHLDKVSD